MKKNYFLLLMFLGLCKLTFASDLFINVKNYQQVTIEVNNTQKQTNKTNFFQFYNLIGSSTSVRVINSYTGFVMNQYTVNIPVNHQMNAEIDLYGNFIVLSSVLIVNNGYGNGYGNVIYNGNGNCADNSNHGHHHGNPNNGYGTNYNTNKYFNQFLQTVKNEAFDSSKLKLAINYARQNNLYAEQIKQIATLFSFDSYRLDFAKAAYANCIDKGNYFLIKDVFSFSSNYNSLLDYISKQ